ncbi:S8 family serine peptidase [Mycolicibacterium iranicum]|uniref:S8 family serine peptidase n=1 Tax=Mycolicibacterium iranicum TaxID=912594 RepID=UPI000463D050|nr:S8 family serine peptidase [Mycolicibacterium iranicum]
MVSLRPAYSAAFADAKLVTFAPLEPIDRITPQWAWEGSSGEGVKVAVLDSGIDATHPAVGDVQGYVAIREGDDLKLIFDTEPHEDSFGHGTACAGVIRSLAPACELYSVKVLGGKNTGKGRVFAAGLRWALENGMHVCNLSLGTTKRDFFSIFHELADDAYFRNIALITAANNMPIPSYPSVYSSVISVASHAVQDPYVFYYNPNPPVEFGALGIDVNLAWLDHKRRTMTGNSYASPHMAGVVAKILGKHPGLTVFQLKTILRELSANVDRNKVTEHPRLLGEKRSREESSAHSVPTSDVRPPG